MFNQRCRLPWRSQATWNNILRHGYLQVSCNRSSLNFASSSFASPCESRDIDTRCCSGLPSAPLYTTPTQRAPLSFWCHPTNRSGGFMCRLDGSPLKQCWTLSAHPQRLYGHNHSRYHPRGFMLRIDISAGCCERIREYSDRNCVKMMSPFLVEAIPRCVCSQGSHGELQCHGILSGKLAASSATCSQPRHIVSPLPQTRVVRCHSVNSDRCRIRHRRLR